MDTLNTPTIVELRFDDDKTHQHAVYNNKRYTISADMHKHIVNQMFDLVETSNYIGVITYAIRSHEITFMEMELETMLLECGEQYPVPNELYGRVQRALGNLQVPHQLKIKADTTSISIILDKLGD
jgi:hypothetical protein